MVVLLAIGLTGPVGVTVVESVLAVDSPGHTEVEVTIYWVTDQAAAWETSSSRAAVSRRRKSAMAC